MSNAISRKLAAVHQKGALRSVDVANIIGTRPETVSRWNQGRAFPRPDAEKVLIELEYIVDQLADFYAPRDAGCGCSRARSCCRGKPPPSCCKKAAPAT